MKLRRTRLWVWWERLSGSFWFLPMLMTAGGALVAVGAVALDAAFVDWTAGKADDVLGWATRIDAAGLRTLLSTLAASMINVTSIVFSITIVALTLASSQLGPRLIRSFMHDRVTQVAMGGFLGTFVFCLLALGAVRGGENSFTPRLSALIALLLVLFDVGLLIVFIHHMAVSIQATTIIGRVTRDLLAAIESQFPEEQPPPDPDIPEPTGEATPVTASESGYVVSVDFRRLVQVAARADGYVWLRTRPGRFLTGGEEFARFRCGNAEAGEELGSEVRKAVDLGVRRSLSQDAVMAVEQLTQIALRALSPGVNDPQTAIVCIDHLGGAMAHVMRRWESDGIARDESGTPRVLAEPLTLDQMFDSAFLDIRHHARQDPVVLGRLFHALTTLAQLSRSRRQREVIARHGDLVWQTCLAGRFLDSDHRDLEARHRCLERTNVASLPGASEGGDAPAGPRPTSG